MFFLDASLSFDNDDQVNLLKHIFEQSTFWMNAQDTKRKVEVHYDCTNNIICVINETSNANVYKKKVVDRKQTPCEFQIETHEQLGDVGDLLSYSKCSIHLFKNYVLQSSLYPDLKIFFSIRDIWSAASYVQAEKKVITNLPKQVLKIQTSIPYSFKNKHLIEYAKTSMQKKIIFFKQLLSLLDKC